MHIVRIAGTAVLSSTLVVWLSHAAFAAIVVAVSPSTAVPGNAVTVSATGCSATSAATASSAAFAAPIALTQNGAAVSGVATVGPTAVQGTYTVVVQCDGASSSASLTVVASSPPASPTLAPTQTVTVTAAPPLATVTSLVTVAPSGAAGAGDGASRENHGFPYLLAGSAVAVAVTAGGLVALFRRARGR